MSSMKHIATLIEEATVVASTLRIHNHESSAVVVEELAEALRQAVDSEPQLVTLVKEIHEATTRPPIVITGIPADVDAETLAATFKDWKPVIVADPGVQVTAANQITLDFAAVDIFPESPVPATGYGVRITYADDTADDIDNIESLQVYDKATGKFPFGFVGIEQAEGPDVHHAVYWDDEGVVQVYDDRLVPKGGW